jgi:hypothetical protein
MNQLKRYYWFGKSHLQTIAVHFLVYLMASGLVLAVLDTLGGGETAEDVTMLGVFLVFVVWTGRALRGKRPPTELDILASREDSPRATEIMELLEGNPSVDRKHVDTLVGSLFDATRYPRRRSGFWSELDCGDGEVYERLFGLYAEHPNKRLLLVVERLARDAPMEARAYEEALLAELDPDAEKEVIMLDDWQSRRQYFWTIPALTLAHVSRELPGSAERYTPMITEMLDPQGHKFELWGVLALGELAAHEEAAMAAVRDCHDSRVSVLREAAAEITAHYREHDHPYPAGRRLDEFDVEHEKERQEWEEANRRARSEMTSWDDYWWEDDW